MGSEHYDNSGYNSGNPINKNDWKRGRGNSNFNGDDGGFRGRDIRGGLGVYKLQQILLYKFSLNGNYRIIPFPNGHWTVPLF